MPRSNAAVDMGVRFSTPDGTTYVEAGAGEPIVFVHGVGMNHRVWSPQLSFFSGECRAIAYDLMGHGESPLPPQPTALSHLSGQLSRLLDYLEVGRVHLVGHSMGALVALDFALRHPHRVSRLVALNAVYQRSKTERASAVERANRLDTGDMDQTTEATIERWFEPGQNEANPTAISRVRHWLESADRTGYARIYRLFAISDDAFAGQLGGLRLPALFVTGEHDPNSTPEMSRRMASEAPDGSALVIDGQRHMMSFFAPELVNPHIHRFLLGGAGDSKTAAVGGTGNV